MPAFSCFRPASLCVSRGFLCLPRFSIFNMFDDLLLLGRGGLTVFLGSSWLALPYFSMLGWELPEGENPADFLLDIIAGQEINPRNSSLTNTVLFLPLVLFSFLFHPFLTSPANLQGLDEEDYGGGGRKVGGGG